MGSDDENHVSFEEGSELLKARISNQPEFGVFDERQARHVVFPNSTEPAPIDMDDLRQMRRNGRKNAGRRFVEIMAENNVAWIIEETKKYSLDEIYELLASRDEEAYLDFLKRTFPDKLEEIKAKYGIPPVKRSQYIDVFADDNDPHLKDTISRMTPEEVHDIYLVDRKTNAMVDFLERNFPKLLKEIKLRKHGLPPLEKTG